MKKTVSAIQARQRLGELLEEVFYRGDQFVIERAGKPMAVVIPLEEYESWLRQRAEDFTVLDKVGARMKGRSAAQVEREVATTIREVRRARARKTTSRTR